MASLALAIRWDWFKLSRRWLPWVLLLILLLMSQLAVWVNYFNFTTLQRESATISAPAAEPGGRPATMKCQDVLSADANSPPPSIDPDVLPSLQAECEQAEAGRAQQLGRSYAAVTLPGSIPSALNMGVSVGLILVAILAAGHFGSEYGWGTVRPNLSRGIGRWQFIASRLLLLALLAGAALLIVTLATAVSSAIAGHLVGHPPGVHSATSWRTAAGLLARSWVALLPFIAFASFITLLTRSAAAGMATVISYYLAEQVVVAILAGLFTWFRTAARYLLAQNIAAWVGLSSFGQGQTALSRPHALWVLAAYTCVLTAAALSLFLVRDVAGASGS